jgi:hypothetical protein
MIDNVKLNKDSVQYLYEDHSGNVWHCGQRERADYAVVPVKHYNGFLAAWDRWKGKGSSDGGGAAGGSRYMLVSASERNGRRWWVVRQVCISEFDGISHLEAEDIIELDASNTFGARGLYDFKIDYQRGLYSFAYWSERPW